MRFEARSEEHRAAFKDLCERRGTTMSEVLRSAMDNYIDEYGSETSPDVLDVRAEVLEHRADKHETSAAQLEERAESEREAAATLREDADEFHQKAAELRERASSLDEDLSELVDWLDAHPSLNVFPEHAKVQHIVESHDISPDGVLEELSERGVEHRQLRRGGR